MADQEILIPDDDKITDAPVITAEEGVEDLKKKLLASEASRLEAETRARAAQERAVRASGEVEDTNLTLVKSAIDTTKRDREQLKANYAAAMANGDFAAAADIQQAMGDASARLLQLDQGREAMEQKAKLPKPQPMEIDPVEALARQLTAPSAAWVRAHPEFARDQRLYGKMLGAHNVVMADGVVADSPDYFARVEAILGVGGTDDGTFSAAAAPAQQRSSPPPAAPAQRGGARSNVVRLSPEELEVASLMGMKPEDYAKNKAELKAAGRLN